MIGYHFLRSDPAERHPEDREIVIGKTLRKTHPVIPHRYGYHASVRSLDALKVASGPIAMKVKLGGQIISWEEESVASERTALAVCDATEIRESFTRQCALDVIGDWTAPAAVMQYLLTADRNLSAGALEAIGDLWIEKWRDQKLSDERFRAFVQASPDVAEAAFVYGIVTRRGSFISDWHDDRFDSYVSYMSIYAKAQQTFCARPVTLPCRAYPRGVPVLNRLFPYVSGLTLLPAFEEMLNRRLTAMLERGFARAAQGVS